MIELERVAQEALRTAEKRAEKGQLKAVDTLSLLKHCAGEVVEATQAYAEMSSLDDDRLDQGMYKDDFALELADVITCVLIIASREGIDIEEALLKVQEKNKRRAE